MSYIEYRKEFPIFEKNTYLNTCSLGALSRRHREYVNRFLDLWEDLGASAWYEHWLGAVEDVRTMTAKILGADEDEIAIGHSVSTLLSTISGCLDFTKRNTVVVTDLDFPTSNYQWLSKERLGVDTKIVTSPDSVHVPRQAVMDAIDEDTAVVSTSHVFFSSGYIQDIEQISAHASEQGALTIIDAYQSVGQVSVNVHDMKLDILITGGLKWLLGGPGITYLYVRRDLIEGLEPTAAGWFGVKDQFGFDQTSYEYLDSARRFETGTPATAAVFTAKAGLELILEIGIEAIQKRTKELAEELVRGLEKAGFTLRTAEKAEERSAIIMIKHPNPKPVVRELALRNIIVDYRKDNIRVSPYFYNTSEDIATLITALQELA